MNLEKLQHFPSLSPLRKHYIKATIHLFVQNIFLCWQHIKRVRKSHVTLVIMNPTWTYKLVFTHTNINKRAYVHTYINRKLRPIICAHTHQVVVFWRKCWYQGKSYVSYTYHTTLVFLGL